MKRMSEVLNIRVVKNAFYDASNDSWICAFVDEEKAQHAAHAINHADALADALEAMIDMYCEGNLPNKATLDACSALAAYRGDE